MSKSASCVAQAALCLRQPLHLSVQKQRRHVAAAVRPQQPRGTRCAVAVAAQTNGAATSSSPFIGAPQQQHVIKMVNLVHTYFDTLLTQGDLGVLTEILEQSISHKDMVRNIGRVGLKEYTSYLTELHKTYPDYYVKPTQFGIVDNRSMFVSFEGQVSAKTPKFVGVDVFLFNSDASKIREVQVYRSNWLGAQGHEERKKLAQAAARVGEAQAVQRGQMP